MLIRITFNLLILHLALTDYLMAQSPSEPSYPSIFLRKEKVKHFATIHDFKGANLSPRQEVYLQQIFEDASHDLSLPYIDPTTDFPGRSPIHRKHANVSHDMTVGLRNRLLRAAFLFLYTSENKYKDLIIQQIKALYDTEIWPAWCDKAHMNRRPYVDIRTYRISMYIALCYNWLHDSLTPEERAWILTGLDRRAIQPFWEKIEQKPHWYVHRHNWFTNMYGGMGITAMAIRNAHPEAEMLLDTIVPAMIEYHEIFGSDGEFNEPPGYTGASTFSAEFAEAYRYYTNNEVNLLGKRPFPQICYWMMYHTIPPHRIMAFGDTPVNGRPRGAEVIAAVANASNDGILQWYYLENFPTISTPLELLWFNPSLEPIDPSGTLALGQAYYEYGASLISRTSWDQRSTACVVYGKAGREANHDDNDVGQLLIDGYGERLIIDPGKPDPIYPADYFRDSIQYRYYSRSAQGHNILTINGKEILSEPNALARGVIVNSSFDDSLGSYWQIDLSTVYPHARRVKRFVGHLFPGLVVVVDIAALNRVGEICLRWHTISPPELDVAGNFTTSADSAYLSAKVISLKDNELELSTDHHRFEPPYHLSRQGDPLVQNHEPYVRVETRSDQCAIMSLFAISKNDEGISNLPSWQATEEGWKIEVEEHTYLVQTSQDQLILMDTDSPKHRLVIPYDL